MNKVHVSSPEAIVFLKQAAKHLNEHHRKHGSFPQSWGELDMTYVNGPYHLSDPDIRPPADGGNTWRPKNSNYHYRLFTSRSPSGYHVDAVGPAGNIEYYIESGQQTPVKVDPAATSPEPNAPR